MMEAKKEIKFTVLFIFLALVLAFGSYDTLGASLNTDVPVVSVISPSMVPTFYKGDLLIIKGTNFKDLKEGDVIVYDLKNAESNQCLRWKKETDRENIPIVHRIIAKRENYVITKGDNNPGPDPCEVNPDEIKGKMVLIVPKIGYIKLKAVELWNSIKA